MATIRYNYAFLKDSDVANNQSRGISLQFNGYALLSAPTSETIPNLFDTGESEEIKYVPSLNDLINASVTVLYRDINYTVNSGVARSADRNYESALKNPALHMFQDLVVRAADEYKLEDSTGRSSGQTEVQIPVYDTMFGNRINGAMRVDGILLYGQAYNKDFYSEVQQGKIENSTPIGIIYFDGDGPEIDPTSGATSKDKSVIRFLIGIIASLDATGMVESSSSYNEWSKFKGNVHVVNENLLTTSSFVVHGHDVIPTDDPSVENAVDEDGNPVGYGAVLNRGPTIDVQSRMFFTNDVPGANNFDHNVDFGSPARLTVLTHDEAVEFSHGQKDIGANQKSENRKPQTMLGKVNYYDDQAGFKHAYMDGIVESYFTASGRREEGYKGNGKLKSAGRYTSGPVWDVDWISKNRPAFSLFSENPNYNFDDYSWADYLLDVEGSSVPDGIQETVNANSACFARGVNMFTIDSQAVNGININTRQVVTRGNAFVINSNRCTVFTRAPSEDEIAKRHSLNKFTAFIANSEDVTIRDRVKGTANAASKDKKYHAVRGKTNPLNTVINSTRISIDNRAPGLDNMNTEDFGRNTVLGSHNVSMKVADDNIILGVKGYYFTNNGKNKKNPAYNWSHIENTRALRAFGGPMYVNYAKDCFIFGTGDGEHTLNKLEGYIDYSGTTRERIYSSMIFGENNQISTLYRYKPWEGNKVGQIKYSFDEHNVFLFGKGLRNDVRQTRALLTDSSAAATPTFIFGINNQDYYQPKQVKQFIIGGYRPYSTAYYNGDFRYNMAEFSVVYPDPIRRNSQDNWNKESILTLNDVKGRTIDYGSGAINLGFMKGVRSDQQFGHHSTAHPSYKGFGRINLFKLYQLLKRMYWAQKGDGYVVKYYKNFHDDEWGGTLNWSDYGTNSDDTCLANLVDDNLCQYQYFPAKGPNK